MAFMDFDEINKKTYDAISEDWDENRKYVWGPVSDFLKTLPKDAKILDVGCGTGRHLEEARDTGFSDIVGCDFSEGQLKVAKQKGFLVEQCEMENLVFENDSFDAIICIAALHHLLEPERQKKALLEMARVLVPGGKIILSNWFPQDFYKAEQVRKGKFDFVDDKVVKVTYMLSRPYSSKKEKFERFYYFFEENELIDLCKECGFEILKKEKSKGNFYLTMHSS